MFGFNDKAQQLNKHHHHNSRASLKGLNISESAKSLGKSSSVVKVLSPTIEIEISKLTRNKGIFTQRAQSLMPQKCVDVRLPAIRIAPSLLSPTDKDFLPPIFKQPNRSPSTKMMKFSERGAADKLKH